MPMKHINIITTQNVTIRYELANARDRTLATLVDFAVMIVAWIIFALLVSWLFTDLYDYWQQTFLALLLSYHLIAEIAFNGQSPGKRALGLRVMKINGMVPNWTDYTLRWAFRLVDVSFSLGTVAIMSISSSESGQRLGDLFAGTTVVRLRSSYSVQRDDLVRTRTADNYEARYPEVLQLSDEDMLTVKAVLGRRRKYRQATYQQLLGQTVERLCECLNLEPPPASERVPFLRKLLEDYVALTR